MLVNRFFLYASVFGCLVAGPFSSPAHAFSAQGFGASVSEGPLSVYRHQVVWEEDALDEKEQLKRAFERIRTLEQEKDRVAKDMHRQYQARIHALLQENKALLMQSGTVTASTAYAYGNETVGAGQELQRLRDQIDNLKAENRRIAQSLALASAKALSVDQNDEAFKTQEQKWKKAQKELALKLEALEKDNEDLRRSSVKKAGSQGAIEVKHSTIEALKKKHAQLLKTIHQQNDMIERTIGYEKIATQLKQENAKLLDKLKGSALSGAVDIELEKENNMLRKAVAKRDEVIKRMEILKIAAQAVKADNENLMAEIKRLKESALPVDTAQAPVRPVNKVPQDVEKQYKEMMVSYRKKIREYQEEIAALRSGAGAVSAGGLATSSLQDEVNREHKLSALQMENQELRARMTLLMNRNDTLISQGGAAGVVQVASEDEKTINIVSAKAEVKNNGASVPTPLPSDQEQEKAVYYMMPSESVEMLKERGVLK